MYKVGDIRYWTTPITITGAAVATATQAAVQGALVHSAQFVVSGIPATTTASVVLQMQGSLDRDSAAPTNWFAMGSTTITTDGTYLASATEAVEWSRAAVSSVNTGTVQSIVRTLGAH